MSKVRSFDFQPTLTLLIMGLRTCEMAVTYAIDFFFGANDKPYQNNQEQRYAHEVSPHVHHLCWIHNLIVSNSCIVIYSIEVSNGRGGECKAHGALILRCWSENITSMFSEGNVVIEWGTC